MPVEATKRGGKSGEPQGERTDEGTLQGANNLRRMTQPYPISEYTYQVRVPRTYDEAKEALVASTPALHPCFIFQHHADDSLRRTHCHAYYFNNKIQRKTHGGNISKALGLQGDYETSSSASKHGAPLDLSGAWCYGSKWGRYAPSFVKNISPDILEQLKAYAISRRPKDNHKERVAPTQNHHKNNEDSSLFSIWLKHALEHATPENNTELFWKKHINKYYLSQSKPYARTADVARYARSLRDIVKVKRFNHEIDLVIAEYTHETSDDRI